MGDENSLAGRTQAHKHTAVSSDGGFLDANSITGFSNTSQGSLIYFDASGQATDLPPGSVGESLVLNASTLPAWSSPGGSPMELISTVEVSSDSTPLNHTWSSVSFDDYSMVSVFFNGRLQNVTDLDMTLQNPALTGSVYSSERWYVASGSATAGQQTTDKIRLPVNSQSYRGRIDITAGDSTNTGDRCLHWFIQCNTAGGTQAMILQSGYYTACNVTPVTDSTGIHYNANSGNIKAGFFSSAYKFSRT
jgi:hypothetical protein